MKLYLMTLLVLSSFLIYKAQGIRLRNVALSASNRQEITKISSVKQSVQDDQLLAKGGEFPSGINRKLMTKITSSTTITSDSKIKNDEKNTHDPKPQVKSSPENSKEPKNHVIPAQYEDVTDINEMDYTPARKKSPIHN